MLIVLKIGIGSENHQLVAVLKEHYTIEGLVSKHIVVVSISNPPIYGIESKKAFLASKVGHNVAILSIEKRTVPGTKVS